MNLYSLPRLWIDSDGVLADFERKFYEITGEDSHEYEARHGAKAFWAIMREYREGKLGFFETLPLMPDAMVLFNAVKHVKPTILTGCPGGNWAPAQKVNAAAKHFPGTKIITCASKDKIRHIENPGDILVDDTLKYRHLWEEGGGIFIHHTSAKESIAQLKEVAPIFFQITDRWTPPRGV